MKVQKNIKIAQDQHPILADIYYPDKSNAKLVVFCHGFKGFKDWGAWDLVAENFASAGYTFIKFNCSHNGIGQENLQDFTRLDLFFENNYSKEINDLKTVLDWLGSEESIQDLSMDAYYLIGHSRGGGIALQSASNDTRWSKLATWASISDFNRFGDEKTVEEWKALGYRNFYNSRTKQDMKIGVQFYEDYIKNKATLNLQLAANNLDIPYLIVHGKQDEAVGFSHAQRLKKWCPSAKLFLMETANHVFGSKHPNKDRQLPIELAEVCEQTIAFFND